MVRRVREWICLVFFRFLYPGVLLAASIVRLDGFSLTYGLLALLSSLVRRPTPVSISNNTGLFLLLSTLYCLMTLLAQAIFQIYVAVTHDTDVNLTNCSVLESILRQIGLQKLGNSTSLNAARLIVPDVAAFVVSAFVYLSSRALLSSNACRREQSIPSSPPCPSAPPSRLSKLVSQLVDFLGSSVVLSLMALCGISTPSLIGSVYFVCFLVAATLWACGLKFGRWFIIMEGGLLIFNFIHLLAVYLTQMPFVQAIWIDNFYDGHVITNSTVLLERILGLKRFVYTNCSEPWEVNFYNNILWTDYLNVVVLIVFFIITGIEIRSRTENPHHARSPRNNLVSVMVEGASDDRNMAAATDRDLLREHPSPTRNYRTIDPGDELPIVSEEWTSSRPSSIEGPSKLESSKRFEAFKAVALTIANFFLKQSYIATLIIMMAWSITYHSWLAFTFLVTACLIWMVPQKRDLCLKLSPIIVFYAECLLIIAYIYGFDLTDEELPSYSPSGYSLSEIGLVKVKFPFVTLGVQILFTFVFWLTLRHFVWEMSLSSYNNLEATSLDSLDGSLNAPGQSLRRTSIQPYGASRSEALIKFGAWLISFLAKYWMLVCSLLFLIMALQESVVYRIIYMVLFLCFIITFQISYRFWRIWVKAFWVVVIIYSMVVLFSIYILQFKDIMEKIHNSTGMSYSLMKDIGFQKYSTKDLFVSLLTPTSFLIIIILHLHYFQAKFLAISDVNRHKYYVGPESDDENGVDAGEISCNSKASSKESWKDSMMHLLRRIRKWYHIIATLLWRVLEVHIFKAIALTIFSICALDVCSLNAVLVLAVLVLLPLGFNRAISLIAMFYSSFIIVTRMIYQLNLIDEALFTSNCSNALNSSSLFNETINGAHYFGFKKTTTMFFEVQSYIFLVLLLAFESIVFVHQEQYYNHPHHKKPKDSTIFFGISRAHADAGLISCAKFLANYGFFKFGKESCFIATMIVMVVRLDVFSLVYGLFLGILVLLRRRVCRTLWPGYITILVTLLFIQYLSCVGLPPAICIEYPWNLPSLSTYFPENLKVFLFLPDYVNPPYSMKLLADFFQLLFVCLQLKVFSNESKPDMVDEGGSNESIVADVLVGKANPTEDFVLFKDSYLDYIKVGLFYYSFWITLLVLFITGTSKISLFCLGYLIGCFYFLWFGQDLLLKPIRHLNRIWSFMLLYCYVVLMAKCAFQLVGCVYLKHVSGVVIQLLDIGCAPVPNYIPLKLLDDKLQAREDRTGLVWDSISFVFILLLLKAHKSWYFQHVVNELFVDNELASRGSELINEMTFKRVDTQKRQEEEALDKIRLKVERIREKMQKQQSQMTDVIPYTDHYQVIRSGDYYMFDDATMDESMTDLRDDNLNSMDSPMKERKPPTVGELFNLASVSGMERAVRAWREFQLQRDASTSRLGVIVTSQEAGVPSTSGARVQDGEQKSKRGADSGSTGGELVCADDDRGDHGDDDDDDETESEKKPSFLMRTKTFFEFLIIVCWAGIEQLIVFLNSIARDYICISDNLKEEKHKRKKLASLRRPHMREAALVEYGAEELSSDAAPVALLPVSSSKSSVELELEEAKFQRALPLPLRLFNSLVSVFFCHSELLCYFAMILNAIVYGNVLSIVFPVIAFLWAMLSCPRPSKAFWLFTIGYTEVIIIFKYIFQFKNYLQTDEPTNVYYWPYVLGVMKDERFAALDIFLLFCLFFHRSVLKQHGLWKDADSTKKDVEVDSESLKDKKVEDEKQQVPKLKKKESRPTRKVEKDEKSTKMKSAKSRDEAGERQSMSSLSPSYSPDSSLRKRRLLSLSKEDLRIEKEEKDEKEEEGESSSDNIVALVGMSGALDTVAHDATNQEGEMCEEEEEEYDDTFKSELSRMCCNNRLSNSMLDYYKHLNDNTFKAAVDVYLFMFWADIATFVIAIFGFSYFGPSDPSTSGVAVTTVLRKNKIPSVFLGMLLVQFIFIIIDRAIYLRKQVLAKLIFQILVVILVHVWFFFGLPEITQRRFVDNIPAQLWYFSKCIYFALSAYQIRSGYPTCILGNFLTKKYNYFNLYGFTFLLAIPFLIELRALMDWMFTDTTLALTSWLQMEDIYNNIFCAKCNRSAEKRYKTPRGNRRAAIVKYGLGGVLLFLLIFIIWFPLLLFSMSNAIFVPNNPVEVSVSIKLAGYTQFFSMTSQELKQMSRDEYNNLYANSSQAARTFLSSYQDVDIYSMMIKGESEGMWAITPPAKQDMLDSLKNLNTNATLQFVVNIRRNPGVSSESVSAQFSKNLNSTIRQNLRWLINGTSIHPVEIVNVFPKFIAVPASGLISSVDEYFMPLTKGNESYGGNIAFELSELENTSVRWWSVNEFWTNRTMARPQNVTKKALQMLSFNERVAPSGVLSIISNYGVIGLYISLVLVIGRFVRMYIQGLSYKIMFVELPNPQILLTLCQDIYMVRESGEFRLEEELFAQLIFLYRSPETLIKVTKQKIE